jgi:hypothetical protein
MFDCNATVDFSLTAQESQGEDDQHCPEKGEANKMKINERHHREAQGCRE